MIGLPNLRIYRIANFGRDLILQRLQNKKAAFVRVLERPSRC